MATPHHIACVSRRAKGGVGCRGGNWANRANGANPPPSDPAPARQVTFQVTYGVGWGANRANRGRGGRRRSMSRVEHCDLVVGHGRPWKLGQLVFEEWRSINIYRSSVVVAKRSSDVLAGLTRASLECR